MKRWIHYTSTNNEIIEFVRSINRMEEVLIIIDYKEDLIAKVCGHKAIAVTRNYEPVFVDLLKLFDYNKEWTLMYLWDQYCRNEVVRIDDNNPIWGVKLVPLHLDQIYKDQLSQEWIDLCAI